MIVTERAIQYWLFRSLASASRLVVPNYTPRRWFECDLFSVTKAGFFQEHEIKLSLADFKADSAKIASGYETVDGLFRRKELVTKHQRLLDKGDVHGPATFYFVVPESLSADVGPLLPEWAGLKVVKDRGHWLDPVVMKPAPRLHGERIRESITEHARNCCYWRFWKERIKFDRLIANKTRMAEIAQGRQASDCDDKSDYLPGDLNAYQQF